MSIVEYNIRTLGFTLLIILGVVWLLFGEIHATKIKSLKIVLMIATIVILLALIFSLFASLSYCDKVSTSGTIIDVSHTGSFAGILDTFAIRVEHIDGTTTWYHTSIFSSSSFKKSVQQLEVGDIVDIYANNFFNQFYKYEKINTN